MLQGVARDTHLAVLLISLLSTLGCADPPADPLRIAAASDLQSALPKLAERFQAITGIPMTLTFGASGQLSEQIKNGAPFDVFLAANESFVRDLASQGLIKPDSARPYARGSLVLAVSDELEAKVQSLEDLTKPEVKQIALANPATAPYGKAGKEALQHAGLWTTLEPKIVFAESVRQALMYAKKGDADAALVGRAIARDPDVHAIDIDPTLYGPIIQAVGIVAATARTADSERFATFVLGEEGQSILKEFGFTRADASPPTADSAVKPQ
jgi:molybdate transport system substrate-binding protein